ncbi:iron-sulfur cluster biosynthesis family protein [Paenibacillus montanisoli]|uniref:Iron-sulfur cluster biosynthesis family protein n=1 Tax=Paenibacillus montanisoli TaxID=2081970 RepID=A0A328UA15_9BACL|nr:iron-sulfur cluster biosynthesis family protein [Paenibacillus montanisoli]RAP78191.1 iron-sulfur cluster biosynthesis family protein [Paenibacillus montanisoli]
MHFTFTPSAIEKLAPYLKDGRKSLKLLYDTEGCGCVVSGVPMLQLLDQPHQDDTLGSGTPYSVWYEPRYEVFFEPNLKVDYNEARSSFSLKSDSQIYTANLRLMNV